MKVSELVERLTELCEEGYGDRTIMVATQPSYPLAAKFLGVADPLDGPPDDDDDGNPNDGPVWLVSGDQPSTGSPYAPRHLWELAR